MSSLSDRQLAARSRAGDRDAWNELARRAAPRLAAYLGARLRRPEVVEKLVAEAIYAAWRHIHELEDPADIAAWLRRVAGGSAMRWHEKHRQESLHGAFPLERCAADRRCAADMERLEHCLGRLAEEERMAIEQRYRGGLSGAELAEALHRDPREVEPLLARALRRLARFYVGTDGYLAVSGESTGATAVEGAVGEVPSSSAVAGRSRQEHPGDEERTAGASDPEDERE